MLKLEHEIENTFVGAQRAFVTNHLCKKAVAAGANEFNWRLETKLHERSTSVSLIC
jgi:hypothetical protein